MTVTLPGGPSGPSLSLAPRLCNGFLGCSFQALVEPLQFSWQVALFHTPETLRGLEQAAAPKPQEPPASQSDAHSSRDTLEAANVNVFPCFSGGKKGRNTTARERYMIYQWILNIAFYKKKTTMIKHNILTPTTWKRTFEAHLDKWNLRCAKSPAKTWPMAGRVSACTLHMHQQQKTTQTKHKPSKTSQFNEAMY